MTNRNGRCGEHAGANRHWIVGRLTMTGMAAIAALTLQGCVTQKADGVAAAPGAPSVMAGEGVDEAPPLPGPACACEVPGAAGGKPSSADPDTLLGTVLAALAYNARVKSGIADVAQAGVKVSMARSGYLPTLQSDAGLSSARDPDYEITLSQPLFDWGLTPAKVNRAKAGVAAAEAELKAERENAAYMAAAAFIEVKRVEELVQAAKDNLSAHEHIVKLASERHEGGVGDSSEVALAGVRLGEAQSSLQETMGELRSARSVYYARVGYMPGRLAGVPELALKPAAIVDPENAAVKSPSVVAAQARAEAARESVKVERASLLPKLSVEGYVRDEGDARGMYTGYGLRLTGPTMTGLSNFQSLDAARLAAESAEWTVESARREVASKVKEFIDRAPTLRAKVGILDEQIGRARALRDLYEDQFKVGERSLVDLVNVQADIYRITRDRINARYEDVGLQYGAAAALGRLEQELGVAGSALGEGANDG